MDIYTEFGLESSIPNLGLEAQSVGILKQMFEKYAGYIEINQKLADKINAFQIGFVNKNEDHMAFFGGNLTGVHIVRLTTEDLNKFYYDILDIDDAELTEQLHQLPVIKKDRIVSSELLSHLCLWLIHKFLNSKLNQKTIDRTVQSLNLIILYKYITSLLFNYFRYPADPQVAMATYAQMSNKFAIKQHGSWQAVLEYRTKDICKPGGLHYKTILSYMDDERIIYAITDTQSRIRDMMKNIYREFLLVHERGSKLKTSKNSFEYEGDEILKDKTKSLNNHITYIYNILPERNSFIKSEIVDALENIVHTAPRKLVMQALEWLSDNYKYHHSKEIEELVKNVLLHSFDYLADNRTTMKANTDLLQLVTKLKGIYMSSKTVDPTVRLIRDLSEKITRKAVKTKNNSLVLSTRVAVMLYIVIRAFSMHHYS